MFLDQMGKLTWFIALDFQSGFWQILMAPKNIKKVVIITKSRFFEWNVMPFRLKNTTNTFSRTMAKMCKDWSNQFLKVFDDDVNLHNQN
jgi:hypothetical protein